MRLKRTDIPTSLKWGKMIECVMNHRQKTCHTHLVLYHVVSAQGSASLGHKDDLGPPQDAPRKLKSGLVRTGTGGRKSIQSASQQDPVSPFQAAPPPPGARSLQRCTSTSRARLAPLQTNSALCPFKQVCCILKAISPKHGCLWIPCVIQRIVPWHCWVV